MVKSCSAAGCASRCLPRSKRRGLTFHVFPTDVETKRKWVLAVKRPGIWEPKKADVLCSRHFKKSDFDTRGPNIKLKPGVVPSIFEFPSLLQSKGERGHGRRHSPLKTLPVTIHNHQLVDAASCTGGFQSQLVLEHSYSIMDSPKKLKCKLDQVISELEDAKESLRTALDRDRQRRESLKAVIKDLEDKGVISPDVACKLDTYCWEWYKEGIQEKTVCGIN